MDVSRKKITWTEFKHIDIPEGDTSIYELINGEIVQRASPITSSVLPDFELDVKVVFDE